MRPVERLGLPDCGRQAGGWSKLQTRTSAPFALSGLIPVGRVGDAFVAAKWQGRARARSAEAVRKQGNRELQLPFDTFGKS